MDYRNVIESRFIAVSRRPLSQADNIFVIAENSSAKMIRNAILSSSSLMGKSNCHLLKTVGVTAVNSQQKQDLKTMPVVERENPETLPATPFGWYSFQVARL